MPLIPCPECEQHMSDRARACPHCGMPNAEAPQASAEAAPAKTTGPFLQSPAAQTAIKGLTAWALIPWVGKIIFAIAALAFLAYVCTR